MTLSDTIAAKEIKPWCAGIGSGDATGWPVTDWLEDFMLRTAGPDAYDQWQTHEIPFTDPKVVTALDAVGDILKNDKYVNGGLGNVKTIASTQFQEGGIPILRGECAMHRQASFYGSNFAEAGAEIGEDKDVFAFYLPAKTADREAGPGCRRVHRCVRRPARGARRSWPTSRPPSGRTPRPHSAPAG